MIYPQQVFRSAGRFDGRHKLVDDPKKVGDCSIGEKNGRVGVNVVIEERDRDGVVQDNG